MPYKADNWTKWTIVCDTWFCPWFFNNRMTNQVTMGLKVLCLVIEKKEENHQFQDP